MLSLKKLNQQGIMNPLLVPTILATVLVLVFAVTTAVFYSKYLDQKDNNQPKIDAAVEKAEAAQKEELEAEFTQKEKEPYKNYTTPSEYGSVKLVFPKTWSSYVMSGKGADVNYFGHPNYVPAANVNYALRMSLVKKVFSQEVKQYDNQVKKGELAASAVQIAGTTGTRLDGFLEKDKKGSMVIFPLRDKTLRIWTESEDFKSDFDNIVLKNLTFVP